jgi:ribosomal protein S18 acetylase RimI-like enzyme
MSAVVLRTATDGDIEAISALHILSWRSAYRGIVPEGLLASRSLDGSISGWRSTLNSYPDNLTVAQNDTGMIVGFSCAGPVVDTVRNAPFDFEVYGLHVHPTCHRQGVGTALLLRAFDRMLRVGLDSAIIWTLEKLTQSRRFYEKHGGEVTKTGVWQVGGYPLDEVAYGWRMGGKA